MFHESTQKDKALFNRLVPVGKDGKRHFNDVMKKRLAKCNINKEDPEDEFQWELHLQEDFGEGKSLLMFKANHAMTDGGGLISLCLAMNDTK